MITNNFKNSELGPIPNDWDVKTLGEICGKITDGSHESPKESKTGYYMPSVKDMTSMGFDFSDCKKISQDDYNRLCRNGCKPEIGDVLIAKDGSILKYCFCVENDLPIVILSSIAIIKPNKSISGTYLAHYFSQKEFVASVIANNKTGTGVPRIVLRNFEKILVAFPKELPEQRRIAAALSDIDALIDNLNALIDKKRLIKQATMQQLLSGKKRINGFNDKWVMKKLGDCCEIYRGGSPRPIEAYLTNIGINWIKIGDVSANSKYITQTEEKITEVGAKHSRFVHKGDFILSNSMSFGRPYILQIDGCIHDGWLVIQNYQTNFETDFLYYLLGSDIVFMQYIGMAAGSSVQNLNKEKVANVYLNVPPTLAEQTAISKILSDMDEEISLLEAKKEKYTHLKQGMMSELLSGRIRI